MRGQDSQQYTIEIFVDGNGNFKYSHAALRAKRGDLIRWVSGDGNFGLTFPAHTPFNQVDFRGNKGFETAFATVRADAPLGAYHYAVSVAADNGVWINAGCPEVIILM